MRFDTIDEVRELNVEKGQHFFDHDTMQFFSSIVESGMIEGNRFVTSEQAGEFPREFTVRYADDDGRISTIGNFQQFDTLMEAVKAGESVELCANCGAPTFEDEMCLVNVEPANYGMRDPYPGYGGDLYCEDCAGAA